MLKLSDKATRKDVLKFISKSASFGNLGAFIGAGFSKAVLNDEHENIALSWGELLKRAATRLEIDYDSHLGEGISYPDIASTLSQTLSRDRNITYKEALTKLKREIADLTSWYPNREKREEFSGYLRALCPSWIITTNYDLVIESLLTGHAVPLGPNDPLIAPKSVIPVYHLHGVRTSPEEIIIAQEDYVALFRPNEYRQIKLALTIRESTTLIIGYGLGDVNVLTALDWSKNVFNSKQDNYPHGVIQIIKTDTPKNNPYRDQHGVTILETQSLTDFFDEFLSIREQLLKEEQEQLKDLKKLADDLDSPDQSMIDKFIDDSGFRMDMLVTLSEFPVHLISGFVTFINKCIDETWSRTEPYKAFEGYKENLTVILDILTIFSVDNIPPALFETTAYALQRVEYFIGKESGKSWAAYDTWNKRKSELSPGMKKELMNFSQQHRYAGLERLIRKIV